MLPKKRVRAPVLKLLLLLLSPLPGLEGTEMVRGKERLFGLECECTREVKVGERGDSDPGWGWLGRFRGGGGRGCEREPGVPWLGCGAGGVRW